MGAEGGPVGHVASEPRCVPGCSTDWNHYWTYEILLGDALLKGSHCLLRLSLVSSWDPQEFISIPEDKNFI